MVIRVETDEQIASTFAVMSSLRPHLTEKDYLPRVKRMMQADGYRLAAAVGDEAVRAVAGYRFMDMLYCGRILYVDDLNSDPLYRSKGHGKELLDWLKAEARAQGCEQLHLDSGVPRERAHRFYFREGLSILGYHFRIVL